MQTICGFHNKSTLLCYLKGRVTILWALIWAGHNSSAHFLTTLVALPPWQIMVGPLLASFFICSFNMFFLSGLLYDYPSRSVVHEKQVQS